MATSKSNVQVNTDQSVVDQSMIESISAQSNLIRTTERLTNEAREYAKILGDTFKLYKTNTSDINGLIERSIELQQKGRNSFKDSNKLAETQYSIQQKIKKIGDQKVKLDETLKKLGLSTNQKDKESLEAYTKYKEAEKSLIALEAERNALLVEQAKLKAPIGSEEVKRLDNEINEVSKKEFLLNIEKGEYLKTTTLPLQEKLLEVQGEALEAQRKVNAEWFKGQSRIFKTGAFISNIWDKMPKAEASLLTMGLSSVTLGSALQKASEYYFRLDTYSTNFAKNSGLSKDFAKQMTQYYQATENSLTSVNPSLNKSLLTIKAQAEAQEQLQTATGQLSLYTVQATQDQLYITKQLGLQGDEAAKIAQLGLIQGKSAQQEVDDTFDQTAQLNAQLGLRLSGRDVLKEVAKVGGVISANYGNDVIKLSKAVAQSKALGVSIQEAAAASRTLLDFESSIENELEASLLTGKQWNLDKARSLALSGDSAGALREELKNIGTLADFQKENVVAKEAEAKAIGMSVDQLADALRQQEVLKTSTVETQKAQEQILKSIKGSSDEARFRAELNSVNNGIELKAMEDKVSKQLEYDESMERVGDAMKSMVDGPMGRMIEGFTKILSTTTGVVTAVAAGAGYMGFMAARAIATAFASEATAAAVGNIAGLVAAGAATAFAIAELNTTPPPMTDVHDALIAPTGQMVLQTPEGNLIRPSKNDSVLFAPNAGDAVGNQGGNSSSARMESLLSSILNSVSKPGSVFLDSTKLGTTQGMSYSVYA